MSFAPLALVLVGVLGTSSAFAQSPAEPPRPPANRDAMYEFLLARRAEAADDNKGAEAALQRAIALDPTSAELRAELAGFFARQNRADEAVAAAEKAVAIDPESEEGHRILGLVYAAWADRLGANPAEALVRATGDWTLRSLCLVLAVTPLRVISATPQLARFRRMLGLFVFFYGALHLLSYAWFDMGFDVPEIVRDIFKRPFILVGFAALVLLLLLAATSFNRAIKRLGARRWQALHRSVYAAALLALLHFFWMRAGKNDFGEVAVYAVVVALLLGWRVARRWRKG